MKIKTILLITIMWGNFSQAADILMVGLDKDGVPVEVVVPDAEYKSNLKKAIASVQTSALPVLQKKSEIYTGWMLRSAVFGLGVNIELGLGEIKFGILPRFRIGFSNAKEPSIP